MHFISASCKVQWGPCIEPTHDSDSDDLDAPTPAGANRASISCPSSLMSGFLATTVLCLRYYAPPLSVAAIPCS